MKLHVALSVLAFAGAVACSMLGVRPSETVAPPVQTKEAAAGTAKASEGETVSIDVPTPQGDSKAEVGKRYIDFSAPKIGGGSITLSEFVGNRLILLQFWGIRCAPCIAEMSFLSQLQERHRQRGLLVIGVNTDSVGEAKLAEAMAARGLSASFPLVCDPSFSVSKQYTQGLIPVAVLIDRGGMVRAVHTGYNPAVSSTLDAEVESLLGEIR